MIIRTIFRVLWAAIVFVFAVAVALVVLFVLGAIWVGDELRAAAPNDPVLAMGAQVFGMVLFVGTVTPALTVSAGSHRRDRRRGAAHSLVDVLRACRRRGDGRDPGARLAADRSAPAIPSRPIHDDLRRGRLRRRLRLLAVGWAGA